MKKILFRKRALSVFSSIVLVTALLVGNCLFAGMGRAQAASVYSDSGLTAGNEAEFRAALSSVGHQQFITVTADFDLAAVIDSAIMNPSATDIQLRGDAARSISVTGNFRHFNITTPLLLSFENVALLGLATLDSSGFISGGGYGGGISITAAAISVTLDSPVISRAWSSGHGGAIIIADAALNITGNARITNNGSVIHGGAIYASGANVTVNIDSGTISGNAAGGTGGGVFCGGVFMMTGGAIENNTAQTNGGGLLAGGVTTITGTASISNNKGGLNIAATNEAGGAIYSQTTLIISGNATINGNESDRGGGLCTGGPGAEVTISGNATVSGNKARNVDGRGGGIFCRTDTVLMTIGDHVKLAGNQATNGGAVYFSSDTTQLIIKDDVEIAGNTAVLEAGGIFATGAVDPATAATIERSVIFFDNTDGAATGDADVNWTAEKIYYNANDGTGNQFRTFFLDDAQGYFATVSAREFTRAGYPFIEWNTLANGMGSPVAAGTSLTEETQLYAIWERLPGPPEPPPEAPEASERAPEIPRTGDGYSMTWTIWRVAVSGVFVAVIAVLYRRRLLSSKKNR